MDVQRDNLQMCRTCLFDPIEESCIKQIKLIPIFSPDDVADTLNEKIFQVFDIKIEKNDIKPKLICERCHTFMLKVYEKRKVAAESQIIINFITAKRNKNHQGKRKKSSPTTEINNEKTKKATSGNVKCTTPEMMKETKWAIPKELKKSTTAKAKRVTKKLDSEIQRRFKSITDYIENQCLKE